MKRMVLGDFLKLSISKFILSIILYICLWNLFGIIITLFLSNNTYSLINTILNNYQTIYIVVLIILSYLFSCFLVPLIGVKSKSINKTSEKINSIIIILSYIFISIYSFSPDNIHLTFGSISIIDYMWVFVDILTGALLLLGFLLHKRLLIHYYLFMTIAGIILQIIIIRPQQPMIVYFFSLLNIVIYVIIIKSKNWKTFK